MESSTPRRILIVAYRNGGNARALGGGAQPRGPGAMPFRAPRTASLLGP